MISLENDQRNNNLNPNNFVSWNDLDNMREEDELEYIKNSDRRPSKIIRKIHSSISQEL